MMTDHKMHAMELIASGNPEAQGAATAHALLHLADVIEAGGHDVVDASTYAEALSLPDADDAVTRILGSYYFANPDDRMRAEEIAAESFIAGRRIPVPRFDPLIQEDPDWTTKVVQEVYDIRLAQQAQGWTAEHDLEHGATHLKDLAWQYSWGDAGPMKSPREQMLISAALLIAAVEVLDRGGKF